MTRAMSFKLSSSKMAVLASFASGLFVLNMFMLASRPRNIVSSENQEIGRVKSARAEAIVVDHTSVELFEQIPDEYIEAAKNMRMLFVDRSVGGNINDGLTCLSYPSPSSAPSHCRRPDIERSEIVADVKYNRSNWVYQYWDGLSNFGGGWQSSVPAFISMASSQLNNFDVLSFQFSYLEVDHESTIDDPEQGFFYDEPTKVQDIYDYERFELEHPEKEFIYWTSSLARGIGSEDAQSFNDQMRDFAISNNKILFDVADIESHDPNGDPCYDNRDGVPYSTGSRTEDYPDDGLDLPAICKEYTTETDGGHLGSVSTGKIRIAKAFWVLMAQVAGWDPYGNSGGDGSPVSNTAPVVRAGENQTVGVDQNVVLQGSVNDDGLPDGSLTTSWSVTGGESASVNLLDPSSLTTNVVFGQEGSYELTLTADDGELVSSSTVSIQVVSASNDLGLVYNLDFNSNPMNSCEGCVYTNTSLSDSSIEGQSYDFDGTSSNINLGRLSSIKGGNEFTFSTWIRPGFDQSDGEWRYIISDGAAFRLFFLSNIQDWRATLRTTTNNNARVDTQGLSWTPNSWHMITVSYGQGSLKIYWDGELKAESAVTGDVMTDTLPTYISSSTQPSGFYKGLMDDLRIYDRTLSSSEVSLLYLSGSN